MRSASLVLLFALVPTVAAAQAKKQPAPQAAPAPKAPAAAEPSLGNSPDPAKAAILNSPEWQRVVSEFNNWLSVQKLYPQSEIPRVKAQFKAKVATLSADELKDWLTQMESKLQVLMSPEARDAREWLGYFVSASAVLPEEEIKRFDIVNMTTDQLQQTIDDVETRRSALRVQQQAFDQTRQQQVQQTLQQTQERNRQIRGDYTNRSFGSYFPSEAYQSQFAPRRQIQSPINRGPSLWVGPFGVGFAL